MKYLKLNILFILILLIPILSLKSQDFWEQLYFPDSTAIYCIAVNDQGNIFIGAGNDGVSGGLYRSIDTAQSWELVLDLDEFSVPRIAINESGDLYVGRTGFYNFMVSQDNGNNWEVIELPSTANVTKILCIGIDTVFVSLGESYGALLLRTVDSGQTWVSVFTTIEHTSEYVSDIAVSNSGDIYISLMCYFANMGGVYKSEDWGDTWEYVGLINHQVWSLEFNSNDDLFIGVWSDFIYATGGLYVLYNGADEIEELLFGPTVADMVINSDDDIYFADVPGGILRSLDNGQTFEYVNEGFSGTTGRMSIDSQGFIYLASIYSSNRLAKSIDPTITGIETEPVTRYSYNIKVFPNPAYERLTIIFKEIINHNNTDIIIFNTLGIEVKQVPVSQNVKETFVDTSNLEAGLYFVVMNIEGNEVATGKFLVVK